MPRRIRVAPHMSHTKTGRPIRVRGYTRSPRGRSRSRYRRMIMNPYMPFPIYYRKKRKYRREEPYTMDDRYYREMYHDNGEQNQMHPYYDQKKK